MHAAGMQDLLALLPAETQQRMVMLYLELLGPGLAAVEATLHDAPAQAVQQLHRVAGGAAMLQDHQVAQLARAIEQALLDDEVDRAIASWPALLAAAASSRQLLEQRS